MPMDGYCGMTNPMHGNTAHMQIQMQWCSPKAIPTAIDISKSIFKGCFAWNINLNSDIATIGASNYKVFGDWILIVISIVILIVILIVIFIAISIIISIVILLVILMMIMAVLLMVMLMEKSMKIGTVDCNIRVSMVICIWQWWQWILPNQTKKAMEIIIPDGNQ